MSNDEMAFGAVGIDGWRGPPWGRRAGSAGGGGRGPSWVLLGARLHFGGASLLCALVLMVFGDVSVAIC